MRESDPNTSCDDDYQSNRVIEDDPQRAGRPRIHTRNRYAQGPQMPRDSLSRLTSASQHCVEDVSHNMVLQATDQDYLMNQGHSWSTKCMPTVDNSSENVCCNLGNQTEIQPHATMHAERSNHRHKEQMQSLKFPVSPHNDRRYCIVACSSTLSMAFTTLCLPFSLDQQT